MHAPTYEIYLPASVRFDSSLSAAAKVFYGELQACGDSPYSPLDTDYFAVLYHVKPKTVNQWVAQLEEAGYLYQRYNDTGELCVHLS